MLTRALQGSRVQRTHLPQASRPSSCDPSLRAALLRQMLSKGAQSSQPPWDLVLCQHVCSCLALMALDTAIQTAPDRPPHNISSLL